jgi:hypothetical protein
MTGCSAGRIHIYDVMEGVGNLSISGEEDGLTRYA